jgi:hypothetical protein
LREFIITMTHADLDRLRGGDTIRCAHDGYTFTVVAGRDDAACDEIGAALSGSDAPLAREAKGQ